MSEIAVFRQNLFRVSETFITQQAQAMRRYAPLYLGRFRYGDGPVGAQSRVLGDLWRRAALARIGAQMLTRDPAPYLRLLGDRRPALVHAHFGVDGVYALPLARRLGVPLVTMFHGFDATLSTAAFLCSPAWVNYPLFRRTLARHGQLFLCTSDYIRERVLAMGFPAARTRVHYIGVDCGAIRPRDPQQETPTILHVARLVEMKGTEYLLRAFALLSPTRPALRLVIIGDGPLRGRLEVLARALGIGGQVSFRGAQPYARVLEAMRAAMMLVLPSVYTPTGRVEGLGMVLLEAAATGVPVVGSRVGGIPEGLVEGETGLLAPERDAEALAARMRDVLDDPDRRAAMGGRARAFVTARFDLHRQTAALEAAYDALIDRGVGP
ncbi:glycosyltransferase [Gluconacetobacter azotocaptans]|uniref:Glycosyltransferase n=1 Tax=Gluconacetobacter azotocaptans TaxID=142834 RepID=A0A7W4JRU1_9PROT|nr:glycosyltransferase [Gluconacetobacter azotocaptans]MBB2189605.1 glycosyltransferase [Gluconacetobacter azotocaptans]MBM9403109.1 glycosyltransferase [Gluconacetobacter azotocaptans]GBQ36241.1 glycosyltransferase [Gluconacetobacter azotocaptans DSM 13594]